MRNGRTIETKHDRKALAHDAGLGRISAISVLAGALCGLASLAALLTIAAAIGVGIHGGTDFGTTGDGQLKAVAGVIVVASSLASLFLAGYVAGRMARRRGAINGLMAGVVAVILATAVGLALTLTHGDGALARMSARDLHVVLDAPRWRNWGVIAGLATAAAMVLGGLLGGIKGEHWHGKLLARALDPSVGPEGAEREAARQRAADAEMARLAATRRVAAVTTPEQDRSTAVVGERDRPTAVVGERDRPTAVVGERDRPAVAEERAANQAGTQTGTRWPEHATPVQAGNNRPVMEMGPADEPTAAIPVTTDRGPAKRNGRRRNLLHR